LHPAGSTQSPLTRDKKRILNACFAGKFHFLDKLMAENLSAMFLRPDFRNI
jgi:hypothetical protein